RKLRRRGRRRAFLEPFLWIVTAGAPNRILTRLAFGHVPGWPAGVYFFGDDILRVGIVVASELPRERSTLLVRLMAAGPLLAPAIAELRALPPDAPERAVAEGILLRLQHALRQQPVRSRKEKEFIVKMFKSWEEGKDEARAEGRIETQADAVLAVLRVRGIPVPIPVRKRIRAEKDLQQLKSWHAKAVVATSIEDVIGTRSRRRSAPAASTARARAR
ncbi:MAG TPA: hypothetical protein VK932_04895, partial [Kofleriaceae bacterium]|nr:hypothetical protein [Kofleriaceae bacterium]